MKKTLAALAVLGAFAGSAFAADVTLYGLVDLGVHYQNKKVGDADAVNTFDMKSGFNSGSRFGLKGTEDLGNGMKVGFVLENGFEADSGTLGQNGRLFGREANLYVQGGFGTLSMGRVGSLSSGCGSYNIIYGYTPFTTGWGIANNKSNGIGDRDRMDNTVTYVTPSFAGAKVYAQYSFQADGAEAAGNERQNKRYAGLGVKYDAGALSTAFVVDTVLNNNASTNQEDSLGIFWGASYDFGVVKAFGLVQYGQNEKTLGGYGAADMVAVSADGTVKRELKSDEGVTGYAISLGVTAPVMGGTVMAQANYVDGEAEDTVYSGAKFQKDGEFDRWGVAVAYRYPLSKRTEVYGFAGYNEGSIDVRGLRGPKRTTSTDTKTTEVAVGMVHKF